MEQRQLPRRELSQRRRVAQTSALSIEEVVVLRVAIVGAFAASLQPALRRHVLYHLLARRVMTPHLSDRIA